jgi:lipopolysaccharide export system protein LptC
MTDEVSEAPLAPRRRIRVRQSDDHGAGEYVRARRRTRLVGWLKIVLPVIAVIAVIGYFAVIKFMNGIGDVAISMSGLNLDAKSLTIDKPRVSGFKGTAQSYDLSAERAIQDLTNPKRVALETISGSFGVQSHASATMAAKSGIYDTDAETLLLKDGVSVQTTTGYEVRLTDAAVDFKQRTLSSGNEVMIKTGEGTLHANSVHVSDGGKKITFGDGVSVTYLPSAGDGIVAPPVELDP